MRPNKCRDRFSNLSLHLSYSSDTPKGMSLQPVGPVAPLLTLLPFPLAGHGASALPVLLAMTRQHVGGIRSYRYTPDG